MEIGRKIYYEMATGNVIVSVGERTGDVVETTTEQDFISYAALSERVPSTVGVVQLEYGQYAADFEQCNGYRVDPDTQEILFSYPDPAAPEAPPAYRPPLTVEIEELKAKQSLMQAALDDIILSGGGA